MVQAGSNDEKLEVEKKREEQGEKMEKYNIRQLVPVKGLPFIADRLGVEIAVLCRGE